MKLGTVLIESEQQLAIATSDTEVVLMQEVWPGGPSDMRAVLTAGFGMWSRIESLARRARKRNVDTLTWLPPIPRPGKVICLALNNSANKDRIMSGPVHPAFFTKPNTSLLGHGQAIRLHRDYGRVHPEPELAVVISRVGRDIKAASSMDYVFGYTIMNDLTSPTLRADDTFHYRAIHPGEEHGQAARYVDTWVSYPGRYKGADGFGPMGPWITTRDEIPDPHSLTVRCLHQGRLITEDSTENLRYKVAEVIEFVSHYMTLEPCDIISMGTALKSAGSGQPVQTIDLNALGGPIEVSIAGIGTLRNSVETYQD
jgi:2-keto-4-pentenoate hydratase/2-oxohepta-3-ene-1,7-dioic acid hydratase in catechol pathway